MRGRGKAKSFPASLEAGKYLYQVKQRLLTYNSPLGKGKDKDIHRGRGNSSHAEGKKDISFTGGEKLKFWGIKPFSLVKKKFFLWGK